MSAADFLELPAVQRILERAARAAGTPLSAHVVERNQEGALLAGWGSCAACRYVSDVPRGRWACRASRRGAATMALAQQRPLGFICHLGFACVSVPALPGEHVVLTFGPYVPDTSVESLEYDVRNGLLALDVDLSPEEPVPVDLDDIHRAPVDLLPAVAEWCAEALVPLWNEWRAPQRTAEDLSASEAPSLAPSAPQSSRWFAYRERFAEDVAAALAGGNQPQARALLQGHLEELVARQRPALPLRRARMVRLVSEVLEAVEHAGLAAAAAWDAFPAFVAAVQKARKEAELLDAAMIVLGIAKRKVAATAPQAAEAYEQLNAILTERMSDGITLEEAASRIGMSATALSQRLRRKFRMNFSEYLGRLRIDKAKELLRHTDLTATEIARRVGVADQSHFSKLFRKFENMAPLEYRKRFGRKP